MRKKHVAEGDASRGGDQANQEKKDDIARCVEWMLAFVFRQTRAGPAFFAGNDGDVVPTEEEGDTDSNIEWMF